jgi:hypothetical protein
LRLTATLDVDTTVDLDVVLMRGFRRRFLLDRSGATYNVYGGVDVYVAVELNVEVNLHAFGTGSASLIYALFSRPGRTP